MLTPPLKTFIPDINGSGSQWTATPQRIIGSQIPLNATPARSPATSRWPACNSCGSRALQSQKTRTRAVQEESDSSTGEEDNFKKVSYVSHARDRGTEVPLLNM